MRLLLQAFHIPRRIADGSSCDEWQHHDLGHDRHSLLMPFRAVEGINTVAVTQQVHAQTIFILILLTNHTTVDFGHNSPK